MENSNKRTCLDMEEGDTSLESIVMEKSEINRYKQIH